MNCDCCEQTATVHLTENTSSGVVERHLCAACAWRQDGLAFPRTTAESAKPVVVKYRSDSPHLTTAS